MTQRPRESGEEGEGVFLNRFSQVIISYWYIDIHSLNRSLSLSLNPHFLFSLSMSVSQSCIRLGPRVTVNITTLSSIWRLK